jgi:acyl-CoA dehydrogenase
MIADGVDRMLADAGTRGDAFDAAAWGRLVHAGVPRLLRPEAQGGAGDAWREAAQVLQAAAGRAPALPLADALVGHSLLAAAGIELDGDAPLVLSVAGPDGTPDPADVQAIPGADRLVLAPWGERARGALQPAVGAAREFELADAGAVRARLALAAAAVLTGTMRTAIALGVEYAGLRRAFGRTLGAFQAVQHPLAVAAEDVAASRAALDWAADALESGDGRFAAAVAKARAAEAAGRVAAVVHQVHGAIGFTAEHALHRSTTAMWRWRDRWGDETHWQAELGGLALAAGPEALFDLLDGAPKAGAVR